MKGYLKTLRRLPDDVVLDMATREFVMDMPCSCLCGWALRAGLSRVNGRTPDQYGRDDWNGHSTSAAAARQFGGSEEEWEDIFVGVVYPNSLADIEEAFALRVMEVAGK